MNQQLQWAANTKSQIVQLVGEAQAEAIFANGLFSVTMGSNDYINNYLLKGSSTSSSYNPQQYQDLLISTFSQQLTTLYNLGARKVVVTAVGPLGCIPSQLVLQFSVNGECVPFINGYVQGFNAALKSLLQQLTSTLSGATFVYANAYDMVQSFINNPANYGTCDQHILHSIASWKMVTKQTSVDVITGNHQKHNILLLAVQISCRSSNV